MWSKYKLFFHRYHQEQRIAVKTAGKGGYTTTLQNVYGAPPPPTEEHHKAIEYIQTIVQGMQVQSYKLEGLAQSNAVLASSNSVVLAQLS